METVTQEQEKSQEVKPRFKVGDKVYVQNETNPMILESALITDVYISESLDYMYKRKIYEFVMHKPNEFVTVFSVSYKVYIMNEECEFFSRDMHEKKCYNSKEEFFKNIELTDFVEVLQKAEAERQADHDITHDQGVAGAERCSAGKDLHLRSGRLHDQRLGSEAVRDAWSVLLKLLHHQSRLSNSATKAGISAGSGTRRHVSAASARAWAAAVINGVATATSIISGTFPLQNKTISQPAAMDA